MKYNQRYVLNEIATKLAIGEKRLNESEFSEEEKSVIIDYLKIVKYNCNKIIRVFTGAK